MTERLRYTGAQTVTFLTGGVGEVEPGGEFEVPGEFVEGFLRRPDIEPAAGTPPPPPPPAGVPVNPPAAPGAPDGGPASNPPAAPITPPAPPAAG